MTQVKVSMSMRRFCIKLKTTLRLRLKRSQRQHKPLIFSKKIYTEQLPFHLRELRVVYIRLHRTDLRHLALSHTFRCHLSRSVPVNVNDEHLETGSDYAKEYNVLLEYFPLVCSILSYARCKHEAYSKHTRHIQFNLVMLLLMGTS